MNINIAKKWLDNRIVFLFGAMVLIGLVACTDSMEEDVTPVSAANAVITKGAYIRAMPPGQKVTAMFLTLENTSATPHHLVKVKSQVSDAVELHEHKHLDGVMKMGQVKQIAIPGNSSTVLAPGGYHVMLIGLKKDLKLGEQVAMTLVFEDGSSQAIKPEVKPISTD